MFLYQKVLEDLGTQPLEAKAEHGSLQELIIQRPACVALLFIKIPDYRYYSSDIAYPINPFL